MTDLKVDPARVGLREGLTRIYVRARSVAGEWGSFDIAELDRESLIAWLEAVPGRALQVVLISLQQPQALNYKPVFRLAAGTKPVVTDIGRKVECDFCGENYTDSHETGGFLFLSKAVCPRCAPDIERSATANGETKYIRARCAEGMSFADWCRGLRGGDNSIVESIVTL